MGIEIMVSWLCRNRTEIDVVIPVFNGVRYLEEQIESIANQSFPLKVILRDDGSTDDADLM